MVTGFTAVLAAPCASPTSTNTFPVKLTWSSKGGTKWTITDQENDVTGVAVGASGTVQQDCSTNHGEDVYSFTVTTTNPAYSGKYANKNAIVKAAYPG
ncbi:MAG TPA: hypothetical protein VGF80_00220 [Galbitalea sp.]|jgi:hypothetical protein